MKISIVLIFRLVFVLFPILLSGQALSVSFGTNTIGVFFFDNTLSSVAKNTIVSDIQQCFNAWGSKADIRLRIQGSSVGYLYYGSASPYYRAGIDFPHDLVSGSSTNTLLAISKQLSNAYLDAFAFVQANQEKVQAASDFVDFVNSTNFIASATNNIQNYFIHSGFTSTRYMEAASDISRGLKQSQYHRPSILGFYYSSRGPSETNLWVNLPESSTAYGRVHWGMQPAVWHDGKWKFSFWIFEDE